MKRVANTQGFTLIEIVFSLIILGVLGTLVAQHYFDLREEAELKLAKATVDAAQVKINSHFTRYMAQGDSCTSAVDKVKTLQQISDDGKSQFGEFELSIASGVGDVITSHGVSITATSLSSKRKFQDIALLEVPKCVEISFPEIDVNPDDPAIPDKPTGPEEDLKLDGMIPWEQVMDDKDIKWEPGLIFLWNGTLYACHANRGNGNMANPDDKWVKKVTEYSSEAIDGNVKKEGDTIYVYSKKDWIPAYTYLKNEITGKWEEVSYYGTQRGVS